MKLGMFMMPLHPAGRPMRSCLAEDTEKAILLDQLGYDELWVGEHFTARTEPYPSPLSKVRKHLPRLPSRKDAGTSRPRGKNIPADRPVYPLRFT